MPAIETTRFRQTCSQDDVRPSKASLMETTTAAMKRNQGLVSSSPRSTRQQDALSPRSSKTGNADCLKLNDNERGCPYETTFVNKGRRFPMYSGGRGLSMNSLYRAKDTLDATADARISNEATVLYQNLLPTASVARRKQQLLVKLERLLNTEWPGKDFTVHAFGSSENLLATKHSDLDVCIETEWTEFGYQMCQLARFMVRCGMQKVVCRSQAKVPVVAIYDPELDVSCDMNVNNTLALRNTKLVKTYMQIDERARQLTYLVKHWAAVRGLNEAVCNTLTSYTWTLMVINFLQTRAPQPVLPSLQNWHHEPRPPINGIDVSFADDLEKYDLLKSFSALNTESIGSLLYGFFHHYTFIFDYEHDVVSVRLGAVISRLEKGYPSDNMFCIEEPFTTSRNLGNTADMGSHRGILAELQKAHKLLSDGATLAALLEPYDSRQRQSHFQSPSRHDRNVRRGGSVAKGRQNFPRQAVSQSRHQIPQFQRLRVSRERDNDGIEAATIGTDMRRPWALGSKVEPFLNSELHIDELQRTHCQYLSEQENAVLAKTIWPHHTAPSGSARTAETTSGRKLLDHAAQVIGQQPAPVRSHLAAQRMYLPQAPGSRSAPVVATPELVERLTSWTNRDRRIGHQTSSRPEADESDVAESLNIPRDCSAASPTNNADWRIHAAGYRSDTLSHENLLAVDASFFHSDSLDTTCSEADGSQLSCGLTLASSRSSPSSISAYPSPAVPVSYSDACMVGLDLKLPPPASQTPDSPYETVSAHFRTPVKSAPKQVDASPVKATYASKLSSPVSQTVSPRNKTSPPRYEPFPAVRYK